MATATMATLFYIYIKVLPFILPRILYTIYIYIYKEDVFRLFILYTHIQTHVYTYTYTHTYIYIFKRRRKTPRV
jgi:hypothetical protein